MIERQVKVDDVVQYWDSVAERYLRLFRHEFDDKPFDREVLKAFAEAVGHEGFVCDAGCGPCGHVTRILADQGLRVIGVDISPHCVELARVEQPTLKFEVMDMARMAFRDAELDGLVAYYALHYQSIATLGETLREFARVLKPGGRLLIVAKAGEGEGWIDDPMGSGERVFWSAVPEDRLIPLVEENGFESRSLTVREALAQEIAVDRIYLNTERSR